MLPRSRLYVGSFKFNRCSTSVRPSVCNQSINVILLTYGWKTDKYSLVLHTYTEGKIMEKLKTKPLSSPESVKTVSVSRRGGKVLSMVWVMDGDRQLLIRDELRNNLETKKDGYRQRKVRQFLHNLASPEYAHGIIAAKCYMDGKRIQCLSKHRSMYPSIFNRLQAIARYWSEIAIFPTPLHFTPPLGCSYWNSRKSLDLRKLYIESWSYRAVNTVWQ